MREGARAVNFRVMGDDFAGRDHASVRFPPPLVGVLVVLVGYGLERMLPLTAAPPVSSSVRWGVGGLIVAASVAVLGVWPFVLFKRSGQDPRPWTPTPELLIEGPYKFTRNPMYLMMVLVCAGIAVMLASAWVLLLSPLCGRIIYLTAIRYEETYLERKFGDSYRRYKQQVRRWI